MLASLTSDFKALAHANVVFQILPSVTFSTQLSRSPAFPDLASLQFRSQIPVVKRNIAPSGPASCAKVR
jgi:hypothetical protein